MRTKGYHAWLNRRLLLPEIANAAALVGLSPVLRSAREAVAAKLRPLAMPLPLALFDAGQMEIFVSAHSAFALIVRMDYCHDTPSASIVDILLVGDADAALLEQFGRSLGLTIQNHSWSEALTIKKLKENFGELSPSGKKLADPVYRRELRRFYDDSIRTKAKPDGAWLESLAGDVLQERTDAMWIGQMLGQDELDVLAVFANQTIMVECKDKNLGRNDIYVANAKAKNVGAGVVILLSTGAIGSNVQKTIDESARDGTNATLLLSIAHGSSASLRSGLEAALSDVSKRWVEYWLSGKASSKDFLTSLLERDWFAGEVE